MNTAEAGVRQIRVFTASKSPKIEKFKIPENRIELGRVWEEWIEDLEEGTAYLGISDVKDKVSAWKIYGGQEIKRLVRNLPDITEEGDDDYTKLRRKLDKYFMPKKNKHHARYIFSKERMAPGGSIVGYAARVREKAKECEFGEVFDDRILGHLIQTVKNEDLVNRSERDGT